MTDRQTYEKRIEALPPQAQLAFATACVERLLPVFERRAGERWGLPHNLVSMVWSTIEGENIGQTRWLRLRDFLQRAHVSIDDWGPQHMATNQVVAAALMLCGNYDAPSSGDVSLDQKERARRAVSVAYNAHGAIQSLQRESLQIDASIEFACSGDNERAWHQAALEKLEATGQQHPTREFFDDVEVAEMQTGRGLDGSQAGWYPWDHEAPLAGPDLTKYIAGFVTEPKVAYYVWEAKNEQEKNGTQLIGPEVITLRECGTKDGVARFSYYLRDPSLRGWEHFILYHVLAGECTRHQFAQKCKEIRFRDLDTDVRTLVPYPAYSLADND